MARIKLIKTIYEGTLKLPIFTTDEYCYGMTEEFRPTGLVLEGGRYVQDKPFTLLVSEFEAVIEAIAYWKKNRKSWAGLIETGHYYCGHTGYGYYAPNSEKYVHHGIDFEVKHSSTHLAKPQKLGNLELIANDFTNGVPAGVTFQLNNLFKIEVTRPSIGLHKGNIKKRHHSIHMLEHDIKTLEEFIRLYPSVRDDFFPS